VAIALQMAAGFMNAPYRIARRLLVQRNTRVEVRGRVTSAFFVCANLFSLAGMGIAGLADVIDVRLLYLAGGLLFLGCGAWALVLPGLGQPAAEWRRALALLRSAPAIPSLGAVRNVLLADVEALVGLLPELGGLDRAARDRIMTQGRVLEVEPETRLVTAGEAGESAYFILSGKAVAGIAGGQGSYHALSTMDAGDYFGEIAALTGAARTADVVAEEVTQLLQVPAEVLRLMMAQPAFSRIVLRRMSERLARTGIHDLPRFAAVDPQALRELREESVGYPELEPVPA
jgi:CRP-like cAMP-binding protein